MLKCIPNPALYIVKKVSILLTPLIISIKHSEKRLLRFSEYRGTIRLLCPEW
jgi:hypothetical protein